MFFKQLIFLLTLLNYVYFISAVISSRLVHGAKAERNQFPFVVAILREDKTSIACAGTLLTRNHAISAAHCFTQRTNKVHYCMGGDIYRIPRSDDTGTSTRQIRKVADVIFHPNVLHLIRSPEVVTDLAHNFAVLLMETPFELNAALNIIQLARKDMQNNVPCIGLGFGRLVVDGVHDEDRSGVLGIKLSNCSKLEKNYNSPCMYSPKLEKYMYRGDTGGPLINHEPPYRLYGTYIGTDTVLKHFGVYSEIINSLEWIQSEISGNTKAMRHTKNGSKK